MVNVENMKLKDLQKLKNKVDSEIKARKRLRKIGINDKLLLAPKFKLHKKRR